MMNLNLIPCKVCGCIAISRHVQPKILISPNPARNTGYIPGLLKFSS
ncbi:hypothetical protein C5167_015455 [Papaver somniferum]|uniref:Uncharacterized protein n=1 Tax=Papaver somniferum TaxID=3469 RepID=A0A4Y7J9Z2_PAPSO|nr:hypothetical protein C5167_015455 [Papaver somniferum]